jgi:Transcriptional regulatory protein, C terminal
VRVRFGTFELDEANASLLRDGQPATLAATPFNLLCALARQPGALLTKDALLNAVWGHQLVSESVLKTAISDLRTALGDNPREPRFIETVSRRGCGSSPCRWLPRPRHARSLRSSPSRHLPSSVARMRSPGCSGRDSGPAGVSAPWSGSPASPGSARPRSSSFSSRAAPGSGRCPCAGARRCRRRLCAARHR